MRDCTRKPLGQTDGPKGNGGNTGVADKKHRRQPWCYRCFQGGIIENIKGSGTMKQKIVEK
jgi:hypothetical protein